MIVLLKKKVILGSPRLFINLKEKRWINSGQNILFVFLASLANLFQTMH